MFTHLLPLMLTCALLSLPIAAHARPRKSAPPAVQGIVLTGLPVPPPAPPPPPPPPPRTVPGPTFAVDVGLLHTMQPQQPPIAQGRLIVQSGRIVCLGRSQPLPTTDTPAPEPQPKFCPLPLGIQTFAFPQGVLTPGLVETLSRLGQVEVDAEDGSHDGVAGKDSNLGAVRAIDGVAMRSRALEATAAAGVTAVVVRPLGNALVVGQSVAFHTAGKTVDDALLAAPVAIHVNLGEDARADMPLVGARSGQIAVLRRLLVNARRISDVDKRRSVTTIEREAMQQLREDAGLVALADVVWNKNKPLVVHAHRADEIAAVLRLQRELGFRLVIAGGAEAHVVAAELAAQQVPVIVGPVRVAPFGWNTRQARPDNAAILAKAGVHVALATGDTHNARNLRFEAGQAAVAGLDQALTAVTRMPAEVLGLPTSGPDAVGTLGEGQWADFAVFSADPLQYGSQVLLVSTAGQPVESPTQR